MPMLINLILIRYGESEGNVDSSQSKKVDDIEYTGEFVNGHSFISRLID